MYENAFNNIERALRAEEGIASELDYVEQTSWLLFLKYLHDLEADRHELAELDGEDYKPIISGAFRWDRWASPKKDGAFDHNAALIGEDLITFVDQKLFPHLASFRASAEHAQTIEYKIGEIFSELRNRFRSGYILRDVLEIIDGLSFNTQAERHELSQLYETRIKRMGNAGRNGGEYYTPRPLIRAMIKVVNPRIGETIYDGAVGSAGFLCEAYDHLRRPDLTSGEWETLQTCTFYGQEKKSLAYVIGIMNMVLHGIEAPNLVRTNSLNENVMDYEEKDRHDIILAKPANTVPVTISGRFKTPTSPRDAFSTEPHRRSAIVELRRHLVIGTPLTLNPAKSESYHATDQAAGSGRECKMFERPLSPATEPLTSEDAVTNKNGV